MRPDLAVMVGIDIENGDNITVFSKHEDGVDMVCVGRFHDNFRDQQIEWEPLSDWDRVRTYEHEQYFDSEVSAVKRVLSKMER